MSHPHNDDGHCDVDDTGDHDDYSSGEHLRGVECVVVRLDMADGNVPDDAMAVAVVDEDDDGKDDGEEVLVAVDNDCDDGKIQAKWCYCWRMKRCYCCC